MLMNEHCRKGSAYSLCIFAKNIDEITRIDDLNIEIN